ncbi:MAG: helix-turn-helix transcriptional regulator [Henriciella sp.]
MSISKIDTFLGGRLAQARQDAGLSEAELAERLDLSFEEYALLETGQARIDAEMVSVLALTLDKPIAWFFDQTPKLVTFPSQRGG